MFNAQQFAARLAARRESSEDRWSLLKDFVAEWHAPLQFGDGYSQEDLDAAERRLGFALPTALREWYGLAGKRKDIIARQNYLVVPDELEISDENGLLIFHSENQGVVEWGIQPADLSLADPTVWLDDSGAHDDTQEPIRENDTLSEFALQMIVLETTSFTSFTANALASAEALAAVVRDFVPLGLPEWHWPMYPVRFYGSSEVLVQVELTQTGSRRIRIGAQSREARSYATQQFTLNWVIPLD